MKGEVPNKYILVSIKISCPTRQLILNDLCYEVPKLIAPLFFGEKLTSVLHGILNQLVFKYIK